MLRTLVIGSGMGSLSAAALLAKQVHEVTILEQNWIPGGCTTSYPRKHFVFEAGATTVVGMDQGMSLKYLLDETGIEIPMRRLPLPMKVHMGDGEITKYHDIDLWIKEAKNHFEGDQEGFWRAAYKTSQFVWRSSLKYKSFPPSTFSDYVDLLKSVDYRDILPARFALQSTKDVMKKYGVYNEKFLRYANEQLMITAQNTAEEVNFLFGAAALCYTNYQNFYIDGGLINLVKPIVNYIESQSGQIRFRESVQSIEKKNDGSFHVNTNKETYEADLVISGIPINNTLELLSPKIKPKKNRATLESQVLNSAFQLGIGFKSNKTFDCLHHQIHLEKPLSGTGSDSIFLSLSHPEDQSRTPESGQYVASISTHIPNPEKNIIDDKKIAEEILDALTKREFLKREDIIYMHSSGPKSWKKWTGRKWGFVGGYPQFLHKKPWQLLDVRLAKNIYQVGDTVYPGQGIPGVTLGGIVAAHKVKQDLSSI